ncbi:fatty acid desaturase [Candidatus Cyanaurora vandensis]|uniref:fatty acid desaturase n=1 Tax=Candidatus Cyanaurora vandensis TaxID=2714958 RepID=UPI00257D23B8|nr:fatty acid desaturase [Candidatus Cyanaurora vandensis]
MVPLRALMGPPQGVFSPTLALFLAVIVLFMLGLVGSLGWGWPLWVPFLLNTGGVFALAVVLHDSSHGTAHRTPWLNRLLGHLAAVLQGFTYPVFLRVHAEHHAHVNHPTKDPDHFVSTGGPLWLIPVRFEWHEVFFFKHRLWRGHDLWGWVADRSAQVGLLWVCWQLGPEYFGYCMNLWITPAGVAGLLVGIIFDYLPHRPFISQDRWTNTRVYPSRWLNWLVFGQNYHLAHHLWPNIPWYHYERAYWSQQELLMAKGAVHGLDLNWQSFTYDALIGLHPPSHAP